MYYRENNDCVTSKRTYNRYDVVEKIEKIKIPLRLCIGVTLA